MKAILKKIRFEKEEPNIKPTLDNVEAFDFTPNKTKDFKPEHIQELDKDYKDTSKAKEFNEAVIKTPEDTGIKSFVFGNYFQDDPFEEFSGMKAEQVPDKYLDGYYMHRLKGKTNKDVMEMRFLRDYESFLDELGVSDEEEEDPFAGLSDMLRGEEEFYSLGGVKQNRAALQKLYGRFKASVNGPVPIGPDFLTGDLPIGGALSTTSSRSASRASSRSGTRASSPITVGEANTGEPDEPLPELEMTEEAKVEAREKIAKLNKNARGFLARKKLIREVIPKAEKEMRANKNLVNLVHRKMEKERKKQISKNLGEIIQETEQLMKSRAEKKASGIPKPIPPPRFSEGPPAPAQAPAPAEPKQEPKQAGTTNIPKPKSRSSSASRQIRDLPEAPGSTTAQMIQEAINDYQSVLSGKDESAKLSKEELTLLKKHNNLLMTGKTTDSSTVKTLKSKLESFKLDLRLKNLPSPEKRAMQKASEAAGGGTLAEQKK